MVRAGTYGDIDALVALGDLLHRESPRFARLTYSQDRVAAAIRGLLDSPDGLVLVAERAGAVVGGVLAVVAPHWSSDDRVAQEVSLFVAPTARGGLAATQLICGLVAWAREQGAVYLQVGTSTGVHAERTAQLYEHLGFRRCAIGLEVVYGV